jgi:hypothetical protein
VWKRRFLYLEALAWCWCTHTQYRLCGTPEWCSPCRPTGWRVTPMSPWSGGYRECGHRRMWTRYRRSGYWWTYGGTRQRNGCTCVQARPLDHYQSTTGGGCGQDWWAQGGCLYATTTGGAVLHKCVRAALRVEAVCSRHRSARNGRRTLA